jgi:hypothetical protein
MNKQYNLVELICMELMEQTQKLEMLSIDKLVDLNKHIGLRLNINNFLCLLTNLEISF